MLAAFIGVIAGLLVTAMSGASVCRDVFPGVLRDVQLRARARELSFPHSRSSKSVCLNERGRQDHARMRAGKPTLRQSYQCSVRQSV